MANECVLVVVVWPQKHKIVVVCCAQNYSFTAWRVNCAEVTK